MERVVVRAHIFRYQFPDTKEAVMEHELCEPCSLQYSGIIWRQNFTRRDFLQLSWTKDLLTNHVFSLLTGKIPEKRPDSSILTKKRRG